MRLKTITSLCVLCTSLTASSLLFSAAQAGEATAFELIKEGNRYVGEQCKDKIVQLRSEKSVGTLEPNIWYIVYYDSDATFKATEVKFGAGKKLSVKRPMRMLEPVTGGDTPLVRDQLKVDSDQAIKTALAEPMLKNITVTSTELHLDKVGEGVLGNSGTGNAVWKVKLWAAKLRNPQKTAGIGEVWVSAGDGKVVKNDLKIQHVD
jgi:hypothetical protein